MGPPSSKPGPSLGSRTKSTFSEIAHTMTHLPSVRAGDRRALATLIAVFVVVLVLLAVVFVVFQSQETPRPPARVQFGPVGVTAWATLFNASFNVSAVLYGPYAASGFLVNLSVQNLAAQVPLGASGQAVSIAIGPNAYRVTWTDRDADGYVSPGDTFTVTGLPGLSACALTLAWPSGGWTASAYWTTSSE